MISQEHLDIISSIYDLPLRPERWQSVLDQFAPVMNAAGAAMMAFDPIYSEHHVNIATSNVSAEFLAKYNELFGAVERQEYAKIALNPKRGFVSDMENLGIESIEEQGELPVVQWLSKNANVRHRAASCLNLQRIWTDLILVQFSNDRGKSVV